MPQLHVPPRGSTDTLVVEDAFIGNRENLIPNPQCGAVPPLPLDAYEGAGLYEVGAGFSPNGWYRRLISDNIAEQTLTLTEKMQVRPGDQYHFSARGFYSTKVGHGTGRARLEMRFYNGANAYMSSTFSDDLAVVDVTDTADTITGNATVPAGALWADLYLRFTITTTSIAAYLSDLLLKRKGDGALIVDGAVTTDKLAALAVTAEKVAAGAVTAEKVAADVIQTADYAESAGVPTAGAKLISVVDAPAWSALTTYVIGDLATRAGVVYRCTTGHTNQQPPNGTYWAVFQPLRIGPGGAQVGSYTLDEIAVATLRAIARASASVEKVWYRGNNDSDVNGGAPLLMDPSWARNTTYAVGDRVIADPVTGGTAPPFDAARDGGANAAKNVYRCTVAGTTGGAGNGPTGTTVQANWSNDGPTWEWVSTIANAERLIIGSRLATNTSSGSIIPFLITIRPRHAGDNLDALRYLKITFFENDASAAPSTPVYYVPITDRLYANATDDHADNAVYVSWLPLAFDAGLLFGGVSYFNGYLRVQLFNAFGPSAERDFDFTAYGAGPNNGAAGEFALGGSPPSGGGGGGGGGGGSRLLY